MSDQREPDDVVVGLVAIAILLMLVAIWTAPWTTPVRAAASGTLFLAVALDSLRRSR